MAPDCIFNVTGPADNTFHRFFITNFITIVFLILCSVPFCVQLVIAVTNCINCTFQNITLVVLRKIHCVLQTVIGLYQVASQCRQFCAPKRRLKRSRQRLNQRLIQTVPPTDICIPGLWTRPILVLTKPSPLLAPSTPQTPAFQQDSVTEEFTSKTVSQPPKPTEDRSLDSETPVQQVSPILGTTPRENLQLRNRNSPEDISDVLGTHVFQGYVETPLKTLDGSVVNQPKRFLPLAEEAKCLAEEIKIEKLNEQWAGIPHEQLLNQSFRDQLNSVQILEQLAPLELAKKHLPADIIDILKCLGKADNIPFNQLYYIVENCTDRYYTKVIETFVSIIKRQFADCQLLLVNTACCLKFLEEYSDHKFGRFSISTIQFRKTCKIYIFILMISKIAWKKTLNF